MPKILNITSQPAALTRITSQHFPQTHVSHLVTSKSPLKVMANYFQLSSTQTALCLILPESLCESVDEVRSQYDKAYGLWPAHINILYPFVPLAKLQSALDSLRKALVDERRGRIKVKVDDLGVFRHRKSATLFLKPDDESKKSISGLRTSLISELGCTDAEGTHDGEFTPHLT